MKTRDFDPVLSASLRRELESLADAPGRPAPLLRRPQAWITAATALVLLVATVGLLRLPPGGTAPAGSGRLEQPRVVLTDPDDPRYVGDVLHPIDDRSGTGPGRWTVDAASALDDGAHAYLSCTGGGAFTVTLGVASFTGRCTGDVVASPQLWVDTPTAASTALDVGVPRGVRWELLVLPASDTTTTHAQLLVRTLEDPLDELRDPGDPMYLGARLDPLLHVRGEGTASFPIRVPGGVDDVTFLLSCTSGARYRLSVGGGDSSGTCSGRVDGSTALPASEVARTAEVVLPAGTSFFLLAVPTGGGSPLLPRTATSLPYPTVRGTAVERRRGIGADAVAGRATGLTGTVAVDVTCQGAGLSIVLDDGTRLGDGTPSLCAAKTLQETRLTVPASAVGADGEVGYRVEPQGAAAWTVTFATD